MAMSPTDIQETHIELAEKLLALAPDEIFEQVDELARLPLAHYSVIKQKLRARYKPRELSITELDSAVKEARKALKKETKPQSLPESSDTTIITHNGPVKLVELKNNVLCDEKREYLYDRVMSKDEDDQEVKYVKRRLQHSGMPRVLSCHVIDGEHGRRHDEATFYVIEMSKRADIPAHIFSQAQIDSGEWAATFVGLDVTSRRDRDFFASIIKNQVMVFNIPIGHAKQHTGWIKDETSGIWRYYLRNGSYLSPDGTVDTNIPIAGYLFPKLHKAAWNDYKPLQLTQEHAQDFEQWLPANDPMGRMFLLCMLSYRALLYSFLPIQSLFLCIASDDLDIGDGSAGSGKSTTIDFARGVDGPCPYRSGAECKFKGTLAGTETRVRPIHDLMTSVADFHMLQAEPSESEIKDFVEKLDAYTSSAADGEEIRPRANRDMTAKEGTRIAGAVVLDGERMPPVILSRLRRVAILTYRRGEMDTDSIHANWKAYQAIHTAIGRAILAKTVEAVNRDETHFVSNLRAKEYEYKKMLYSKLTTDHPDCDMQIARSLSDNFSYFITGAYLAERATGHVGFVEWALMFAYQHLESQLQFLANGGPSTIDKAWILQKLHTGFNTYKFHALDMQNNELTEGEHGNIRTYGYKRGFDGSMVPMGPHLANIDARYCYLKPSLLHDELKAEAQRDHRKWTYTPKTLPAALVRMGIAEADSQGRTCKSPRIGGKDRPRLLAVPLTLLDVDSMEDEERREEPQTPRTPQELMAYIKSQNCEIDFLSDGKIALNVPEEWNDEQYNQLATLVTSLDIPLRAYLSA